MQSPQISVIVPVYNAENWIGRCIDSILAQTFTDFELLLVNDGSKDNSDRICDQYAAADTRIHVFHKANGGVSSARNFGLDNARGKWITFVDSDDWIEPTYLSNLSADKDTTDMCLSLFTIDHEDGNTEPARYNSESMFGRVITIQEMIDRQNGMLWNICCKLYRNHIIQSRKIRFRIGLSMGEDTFFNYKYLCGADTVSISQTFDYHYRQVNRHSLSKRQTDRKNVSLFFEEMNLLLADLDKYDTTILMSVLMKFFMKKFMETDPSTAELKTISTHPSVQKYFSSDIGKGHKIRIFEFLLRLRLHYAAILFNRQVKGVY